LVNFFLAKEFVTWKLMITLFLESDYPLFYQYPNKIRIEVRLEMLGTVVCGQLTNIRALRAKDLLGGKIADIQILEFGKLTSWKSI